MDATVLARAQMGVSLAFHIVFAALGVGLPLILLIVECMHLRTGDRDYRDLAKMLGRGTAILFAVGAVSGTVLSFELGLLWPRFMGAFGDVIGPLFGLEGFAFFTEAIFLGVYLYGRERVSSRVHLFSCAVVAASGALSAAFVTLVNAWMNAPSGVGWDGTRVTSLDLAQAMFAPSGFTQVAHATFACYAATAWAMSGIQAWIARRHAPGSALHTLHEKALRIALGVAVASTFVMMLTGDLSAKHVARAQPWKLAAMEARFETRTCAPLSVGGIPDVDTRTVSWALELPCGLSILTHLDPQAEVLGLDRVPRDEWPPVARTHYAFQIMVGAGTTLAALSALLVFLRLRKSKWLMDARLRGVVMLVSPLGFVALEAGWCVTEFGRQPFIARGLLRTADAVTPQLHLDVRLVAFGILYLVLGAFVALLLRAQFVAAARARTAEPDRSGAEGEMRPDRSGARNAK